MIDIIYWFGIILSGILIFVGVFSKILSDEFKIARWKEIIFIGFVIIILTLILKLNY